MPCSKMCRHDFFLSIFQKCLVLFLWHSWAMLSFIYIAVSTHLLPLVVLVKQNRKITRLALSEITETAF